MCTFHDSETILKIIQLVSVNYIKMEKVYSFITIYNSYLCAILKTIETTNFVGNKKEEKPFNTFPLASVQFQFNPFCYNV